MNARGSPVLITNLLDILQTSTALQVKQYHIIYNLFDTEIQADVVHEICVYMCGICLLLWQETNCARPWEGVGVASASLPLLPVILTSAQ